MTHDAPPAEGGEEYVDEPEEAVPGLAVTALAGAVTGVTGFAMGGPAGAVVANAAAPFLAVGFQKVVSAISRDKERRADRMLKSAAEAAGLTLDQLTDRAEESEQTRFLTEKAIEASAGTIWPEGVRAIGRAYAAGFLAMDQPALDIRLRVLGIMTGLDELHVSVLELLANYEPELRQVGLVAIPRRIPSYGNMYAGGDRPDNPKVWSVGTRIWEIWEINAVRPHLEPVLGSLLGELRENGLVRENDTAPDVIKQLNDNLAQQINKQAGEIQRGGSMKPLTLQPASLRRSEPSWSPTELGEKILGFYAEAGAEDGTSTADGSIAGDK